MLTVTEAQFLIRVHQMSQKKELIKTARAALKEGDYQACLVKCKELLREDAQSYDAFL